MRPIRLEFAGLQSYRERQVVDFETLLAGGLFGIFGPTGSGKSTILDAITLALYGTVTRSEGSTKGIMNHAENRLWVQFRFALADAVGQKTYLVERTYKRQASGAIISSGCRLVETTGVVELVLADKDRDLTARVTEILGLTEEDFTKAVVLPQGTFAEFMSMKDATRRQMLQRIFGLGQYGDRLQARLKARTETVRRGLQEVTGRQIELGDASAEALDRMAAALAEAEQLLVSARSESEAVERDYKLWERVWVLQQDLGLLRATFAAWEGDRAEAGLRTAELAAAQRSESLRHPLAEQRAARENVIRTGRAADQSGRAWASAQGLESQERAAHRAAFERKAAEGPGLSQSVIQLRQAVRLEGEIESLRVAVATLADRVGKGRIKTNEVESAILAAQAVVQTVRERRDTVLVEMTSSTIPSEHKEQVGAAIAALGALQSSTANQHEVASRLHRRLEESATVTDARAAAHAQQQQAEAVLARLQAEVSERLATPPVDEASLRFEERWLGGAQTLVRAVTDPQGRLHWSTDSLRRLEREAAELQAKLAGLAMVEASNRAESERARAVRLTAQQQVDAAQLVGHAAKLAASLAPGSACPVCGSTAHPRLAVPVDQSSLPDLRAALLAADQGVAQTQSDQETAFRSLAGAQAAVGAAQARIAAAVEEERLAVASLESVRRDLPQSLQGVAVDDLPAAIQAELDRHAASELALQQWRAEVEGLKLKAETQAQLVAAGAVSLAGLTASQTATAQAVHESQADRGQADQVVAQRRADFDQARKGFDAEGLQVERQRIAATEKRHAELTRELTELSAKQLASERIVSAERQRHDEYQKHLQSLEAEHFANNFQLGEKRSDLRQLAGELPAAPQLTAAEARLSQLESDEAAALARREAAESQRTKAEVAAAAATKEHQIAQTRAIQTGAALDDALLRAGFADGGEAELALRTEEVRAQLGAWLQNREREGNRLQDSIATVQLELAGRGLSQTDWLAKQERRDQAAAALEQSRDDRTRAAQAYQDLQDKQSRWRELETERQGLQQTMGDLEELAKLLRGGAFVEYLASEQMRQVAQVASGRLGQLTSFRYGLELDEDGGFVIRDDGNGGVRRSVSTLSGGETFLTSLSLALALSASIQLRGHYPLEFFFLDEGFGSLDPELLTIVIDTLERLQFEKLNVGLISHVPEIRNRLARRVIVTPADPGGRGSRLELELA